MVDGLRCGHGSQIRSVTRTRTAGQFHEEKRISSKAAKLQMGLCRGRTETCQRSSNSDPVPDGVSQLRSQCPLRAFAASREFFIFECLRPSDGAGARARVSLTMIVRDEENNLPHCLESVRGIFDEIVVVDTGSKDRTVEIARSFGAGFSSSPWIDDFAAARNEALSHATGDYAFWLDADDVVEPRERENLRALLGRLRAGDQAAYVVRCACDPSPDGTGGETVVDHVRLFPLRDDVRWTYRVHEQILPSLRGPTCRCAGPT